MFFFYIYIIKTCYNYIYKRKTKKGDDIYMINNCFICKYAKIVHGSSVPYGMSSVCLPDDIEECTNKQVSQLTINDCQLLTT